MCILLIACSLLMTACSSNGGGSKDNSEDGYDKRDTKLLSGSFLQSTACRNWTSERWEQEFAAMKELGMEFMIIQSVYDCAYDLGEAEEQDWASYTRRYPKSLYPSTIEGYEESIRSNQNNGDALELALKAAKKNDLSIYLGVLSDDRWWDFGWGMPKLPEGKTDHATESYFATWCDENGKLAGQMITEIWERYGEEYGDQIAGWYYYNEIWNVDVACAGTDNKVYATCIGNNMNHMLDAINKACPKKPIMLSPYFNKTLSTAEQYGNFWKDIFEVANFRAGDIFAPQDCVGARDLTIKDMEEWIGALKAACDTEKGMRFWVNNENFTPDFLPAETTRFIEQIEASEKFAETHITFSWNHYYNPLLNAEAESYNNELKDYLKLRNQIE